MNGGRTFYCHSVVELDEQEAELQDLARRLHATLEKAKNWGGREINPIPVGEPFYLPDTEDTKPVSIFEKASHKAGSILAKKVIRKLQPEPTAKEEAEVKALADKTNKIDAPAQVPKPPTPHPFAPKPTDTTDNGS